MQIEVKDLLVVLGLIVLSLFTYVGKIDIAISAIFFAFVIGVYLGNGIAIGNTKQVLETISETSEEGP